jgi:hypothetical protein
MNSSALTFHQHDALSTWLVDFNGNVATSPHGLALLSDIQRLAVPMFASTEHAVSWGSRLNATEHATLVDIERSRSNAALHARDLQGMVHRATQSQLVREAADAFVPGFAGEKSLPFHIGEPAEGKD